MISDLQFETCHLQSRKACPLPRGPRPRSESRRWFDKLTTLSKVEGPVEEPAHPIPAVGISAYPLRGLRERVVAFIVKGDLTDNEHSP